MCYVITNATPTIYYPIHTKKQWQHHVMLCDKILSIVTWQNLGVLTHTHTHMYAST